MYKRQVHSCNKLYYIEDSKYYGHFVDLTDGLWIDLNNDFEEKPLVNYIGNNTYQVTYYDLPDKIQFKSIGGLNIVLENASFQVRAEPMDDEIIFNFDLSIQSNVILLMVMVFLYLGVMFIGMQYKNFGFMSMGFFVGLFIGFMLIQVHIIATIMMFLMNISIFVTAGKLK